MKNNQDLIYDILRGMQKELEDEFDKNFQEGGFFGKRWAEKRDGSRSHLYKEGDLRKSIKSRINSKSITFYSDVPYAEIHNNGGEITVTKKMRGYFWHKYHKAGKKGKEAQFYKAMALKKIGSKIVIPQRKFIGDHPKVRIAIRTIVRENCDKWIDNIVKTLEQE